MIIDSVGTLENIGYKDKSALWLQHSSMCPYDNSNPNQYALDEFKHWGVDVGHKMVRVHCLKGNEKVSLISRSCVFIYV